MVAWLLWIRLHLWTLCEMHSGSFYCGLGSIFLTVISSSYSSNLFFKEMLLPGPPPGCHEILNLSGFSIICSNYINFWWCSWSFCIPQWPMQPSLTHHRLISHVNCSLKKQNVLFKWRLWRKNGCHLFILPCSFHVSLMSVLCFY